MVALPLAIKLVALALFGWLGYRQASQLRRTANAGLDNALKSEPWLSLIAVGAVGDVVVAWLLALRPDITWSLPLPLQYWASAAIWGVALALMVWLFSVTLVLAVLSKDARGWPLLGIALIAVGGVEGYQAKLLTRPTLAASKIVAGVVLQTSGQSCGAAVGANVDRYFGGERTESEMVELFGTSEGTGTSAAQMIYGMQRLGITGVQVTVPPESLPTLHAPAALFLEGRHAFDGGHVVMFDGMSNGRAQILDPLSGRTSWTLDNLPTRWRGHAIEFSRAD